LFVYFQSLISHSLYDKVIALVLSILLRSAYSTCPPEKDIKPCSCSNLLGKFPEVICEGHFIRNLHLNDLKDGKFFKLRIQETSIKSIDHNEFSKAEFENVSIRGNHILTKIDKNAFKKHPKYLTIEKNKKLAEENFYSLAKMLSNATQIIYRYNSIKTVPKNAFADSINKFLERIYLNDNKIAVINPNSFNYLLKLRYLNLKNNLIVYLPEDAFSGNYQLEEIILENNRINVIESNAFNILPKLQYLTLSNNKLTEVSENMFTDVNNSLDIRLNNNKISKIKSIFKKLRYLDSRYNLISYVIEDAINTIRHSEIIKFSNNRISNLSTTFNNLTKLKVLELSNNLVIEVTDYSFVGSDQLELIDLRDNKITQIGRNAFSHMKKLKYLDLSNNSITEIPEELFSQNSQLEFIVLKHNQITQIKPKTFHYLYKLRSLDFSHNYITTIGSKSIKIFSSSHLSIDFESNKLTENSFNKNSFAFDDKNSEIKLNIYLDNNQFTTFPKQIFHQIFGLSLKSEIHLNGNKFDCNCDMIWLNENGIRNKIKGQIQCNNFEGAQLFELNEYEVCNKSTLITSTEINLLRNRNNLIGIQKLKKNKQIKTYNNEGIKCLTGILELNYSQTPFSKNMICRIDI
jgi:Leucine-rich repeat (LRR) protein